MIRTRPKTSLVWASGLPCALGSRCDESIVIASDSPGSLSWPRHVGLSPRDSSAPIKAENFRILVTNLQSFASSYRARVYLLERTRLAAHVRRMYRLLHDNQECATRPLRRRRSTSETAPRLVDAVHLSRSGQHHKVADISGCPPPSTTCWICSAIRGAWMVAKLGKAPSWPSLIILTLPRSSIQYPVQNRRCTRSRRR